MRRSRRASESVSSDKPDTDILENNSDNNNNEDVGDDQVLMVDVNATNDDVVSDVTRSEIENPVPERTGLLVLGTTPMVGSNGRHRRRSPSSTNEGEITSAKRPCSPTAFKTNKVDNDNHFESVLRTVGKKYYSGLRDGQPPVLDSFLEVNNKATKELNVVAEAQLVKLRDLQHHTTLGSLLLPIRKKNPYELWSPNEIAIFESALCVYGKDFARIQRLIKTKTTCEIVEFYYSWKTTERHARWKQAFAINNYVV